MSDHRSTSSLYFGWAVVASAILFLACAAAADPPAGSAPSTSPAVQPPAAPARSSAAPPGHEGAYKSLDAFAADWMQKMERAEAHGRANPKLQAASGGSTHSYRGYDGKDMQIELKPTGKPAIPYVGIVRYRESTYSCADKSTTQCTVTETMPVTEIFRFQNGRWVY